MNSFHKKFITNLFLDSDSISNINKVVIAIANVVNESNENIYLFNEVLKKEYDDVKDSNEYIPRGCILPRTNCYYEQIVQTYTDQDFIEQFGMKKDTFQGLVNFLTNYINPGNIILDKKVLAFLCLMMNDYSFSDVGRLFGLHKSSVSYIFYELASCLTEQRYQFITWPSVEDQHITRIKVNSRFKFPNCVGFIDSFHLKVVPKRYKKHKPETVLVQGVCDESFKFIDIHVGEIGTTKKSRVFKESTLSHQLKNFIDFDNHILGSSEFKLKKNLITPFTSEEILTREEMKFNEIHWRTRSYIGHAFELLKEKFRKLNNIDFIKPTSVNILIYSACVLHNYILMHDGYPEVKEEKIICEDGVSISTDIVKTAEEKRQFLCNYVNYIDTIDI